MNGKEAMEIETRQRDTREYYERTMHELFVAVPGWLAIPSDRRDALVQKLAADDQQYAKHILWRTWCEFIQ